MKSDQRDEGAAAGTRARRPRRPPLLIIAEDVDGEALATLVVNKLRGRFRWPPSRRPASAIAGKRCSKTSPSSPRGKALTEDLGLKLRA
jgi:chaperonin GroEL